MTAIHWMCALMGHQFGMGGYCTACGKRPGR